MPARAVRNFVLSVVVATTALGANEPSIVTPSPEARGVFVQFANVIDCLQKHYVDPSRIGATNHTTTALREFLRSLDPEADLLTPDEAPLATATPNADVGLSFALRGDYPTVITARDGSPAQNARLLAGDQIVAIDGQSTARARLFTIANQLRGEIGSKVSLRVRDPELGTTREVTMERAAVHLPTPTPLKYLGQSVVYFRVSEFTTPIVEALRADLNGKRAQKARALILDLRNNPGGAFDATLTAARLFLPPTTDIVVLDYSDPQFRTTFVSDAGEKFTAPIVVLINSGTADKAEVFAAALRDNRRARLVGSKTCGRGRIVAPFPLPDGSALLIATAVYLSPSLRSFDQSGLVPDVAVPLTREAERSLSAAGFGMTEEESDPVLARAMELLAK